MPRRNPLRSVQGESNVARRVSYERDRRGLNYEALARAMTEAGCPIRGTAIRRIEDGERKVTVDELIAFAEVFDTSIADMVLDLEAAVSADALRLVNELADAT